jgi:hypothetical protein
MKVTQAVAQAALVSALGLAAGVFTAPAIEAACEMDYCEQDIIWDDCIASPDIMTMCDLQPNGECWTLMCS